jgi:hypothetical protein
MTTIALAPVISNENDLSNNIVRILSLDEKIDELNKQMKVLKIEHKELTVCVTNYLDHNNQKCSIDDIQFTVSRSVGQASLSVPLIKRVCDSLFKPEATEKFLQKLAEHRRTTVDERVRLKKVKTKHAK